MFIMIPHFALDTTYLLHLPERPELGSWDHGTRGAKRKHTPLPHLLVRIYKTRLGQLHAIMRHIMLPEPFALYCGKPGITAVSCAVRYGTVAGLRGFFLIA